MRNQIIKNPHMRNLYSYALFLKKIINILKKYLIINIIIINIDI